MRFSQADLNQLDITRPEFNGEAAPSSDTYERDKANSYNQTEDISANFQDVVANCKASLDFFAAFMMPEIFKFFFPPIFLVLWDLLKDKVDLIRDFTKIAIGLPRGLGKTTVIKLFILYIILFTDRHFIAIYSSREALAVNILADVKDFLSTFNVRSVFGDWKSAVDTDTKQQLTFSFRGRDIIIAALGAGTSMRGMNLKNRRPDVQIFDDVQTEECAKSEVESDTLERWLIGTAMKAKDNQRCLFVYIGNMYPYPKTCILAKLKYNPEWISFIAGAINHLGESIWEEMKPIKELHAELRSDIAMGHPEIFFAEVLNDENAGQKHGVDLALIPDVPFVPGVDHPEGKMIIIDPSSGKVKSDNVEICLFEIYDRQPVAKKFLSGRFSPGDTIKHALVMALENNVPAIFVEDVAYQSTLLYWFEIIVKLLYNDEDCGIAFIPINPKGKAKTSRIVNMFKQLLPSKFEPHIPEIWLHQDVRAEVYMEISNYNPKTPDKNKDNKLDCLSYAPQALDENYWETMVPENGLVNQFQIATVKTLQENCPF